MKEILKWQCTTAVKSAAGLYSCFTFKPSLKRGLCSVIPVASECGTAATSHSPHCLCRSHCSLALLCCSSLFSSLDWVVFGTRPSSVCVPCWGRTMRKKSRGDFSSSIGWVAAKVWGCIGSLDVSLFVLIYSWLIWGDLVAGLCWLRCPFLLEECLRSAHSWRSRRLGLAGECPTRGCTALLASGSACHKVTSGTAAPVLGSEVLALTLSLESPEELNLQLAPATQAVSGGKWGSSC